MKVHQLLSIITDKIGVSKKAIQDTQNFFEKKQERFAGVVTIAYPLIEDANNSETSIIETDKPVASTVHEQLTFIAKHVGAAMDLELSKEQSNAMEKNTAQLIINNVALGYYPPTVLIALLRQMTEVRKVYASIPTRDPNMRWQPKQDIAYIYQSEATTKMRSENLSLTEIVVPATEHHPAQYRELKKSVNVAKVQTVHYSGAISVQEKVKILERIDNIIAAVKLAKAQCNETEVQPVSLAQIIFTYINP
jgi:hypothetical protein